MMATVPGTQGYGARIEAFVEGSQALDFELVNRAFLPLLPTDPIRVLDVGCGAGQNAAALARRGHSIVAVEPMAAFLDAGRQAYTELPIRWVQDALPDLPRLDCPPASFGFVLVDAVWHHLSHGERRRAMPRLARLLASNGILALSLRHGPPGAGTRVFPADPSEAEALATIVGLQSILRLEKLPSVMPGKPRVTWTRVAFRRRDA